MDTDVSVEFLIILADHVAKKGIQLQAYKLAECYGDDGPGNKCQN